MSVAHSFMQTRRTRGVLDFLWPVTSSATAKSLCGHSRLKPYLPCQVVPGGCIKATVSFTQSWYKYSFDLSLRARSAHSGKHFYVTLLHLPGELPLATFG